jgi:hypothetical protein
VLSADSSVGRYLLLLACQINSMVGTELVLRLCCWTSLLLRLLLLISLLQRLLSPLL